MILIISGVHVAADKWCMSGLTTIMLRYGIKKVHPNIMPLLAGVFILPLLACSPPPRMDSQPAREMIKVAALDFWVDADTRGVPNAGQKIADMLAGTLHRRGRFSVVCMGDHGNFRTNVPPCRVAHQKARHVPISHITKEKEVSHD